VRKRKNHFRIDAHTDDGTTRLATVPIPEIDTIALVGRVHCTMPALRLCLRRGIQVVLLSRYGKVKGRLTPANPANVDIRLAQYAAQHNDAQRLDLARAFIGAKIYNMAHRLRRRQRMQPSETLDAAVRSIHRFQRRLAAATTSDQLLGLEGAATRAYFSAWPDLLLSPDPALQFTTRTRRPPQDAVNALISFTYSLLQKDVQAACVIAGLDTQLGLLHRPRLNTPSAVLDLMEAFRPVVADSVTLALVNRGTIQPEHFEPTNGGIYLTEAGRKIVYKAYGQRRGDEVTLPGMERALPYYRAFEAQARRLARVLDDPSLRYRAFRVQ
jgi:CRISPR-associated protein Cas1